MALKNLSDGSIWILYSVVLRGRFLGLRAAPEILDEMSMKCFFLASLRGHTTSLFPVFETFDICLSSRLFYLKPLLHLHVAKNVECNHCYVYKFTSTFCWEVSFLEEEEPTYFRPKL